MSIVVGAWGTHDGTPVHIPSFNLGVAALTERQTISFYDSDDSEDALFSYIHDAILHHLTGFGDNPEMGAPALAIATAVWDELLTRKVSP